MSVYYNEIDPRAAAWLRELIGRKVIADGEVDTRSIVDVQPADLAGFRQCHFFAGIGGWGYALRLAGWPDDREVWTGSCPCQPWSVAGSGEGADDPRHLWPAWIRLIDQRRPATIFGEQVASQDGLYWLDLVYVDLEARGYALGAFDLPAACVGAPHGRQRLWFVADNDRAGRGRERLDATIDVDASRRHDVDGRGEPRDVADPVRDGAREHPRELSGDEGQHAERAADGDHGVRHRGAARSVGDAGGRRLNQVSVRGASQPATRERSRQLRTDDTSELGESTGEGSQRRTLEGTAAERAGSPSFWADAEWIPCLDGKARPVEPGSFPLAHGVSARVGRLRGYGNAIVPQVAAEVIRAYMEVRS